MKKIVSLMIGMSLVIGAATFAFAQEKGKDAPKEGEKGKKGMGKKEDKKD